MIETDEVEIDGTRYRVTQLGWKEGRRLLARLLKLIGPGLTEAVGGSAKLEDLGGRDLASFAPAIREICQKNLETELDHLCDTFAKKTVINTDGGEDFQQLSRIAELHFAGKYKQMFEWLWFCLKVNYQDFWGGSIESAAVTSAETPSDSQMASIGPHTG